MVYIILGVRFLGDFDARVSRLTRRRARRERSVALSDTVNFWPVLRPSNHVLARSLDASAESALDEVLRFLDGLPHPSRLAGSRLRRRYSSGPDVFERRFASTLSRSTNSTVDPGRNLSAAQASPDAAA